MLYVVATLGGLAGLAWELLWLHYTALSIGVSSQAAALTLIAFSIGMAVGAELGGRWLDRHEGANLLRLWGGLEILLGICGQALEPGFALLTSIDTAIWQSSPGVAPLVHLVGMLLLLALPAACMGATIPVFVGVARRKELSIGRLYASNVAGAALGIIVASFVLIPAVGIGLTVSLVSMIDLVIGGILILSSMREPGASPSRTSAVHRVDDEVQPLSPMVARTIVAATGFATFTLEVAWFRSLRAAFQATTDSFAIVLFAVLLPLSAGAALAPWLARRRKLSLGSIMALAGVLVLVTTPIIERFDLVLAGSGETTTYGYAVARRLALGLAVLGPSMLLVGVGLPWVLEATVDLRRAGFLYALNTVGASLGSLLAAWLLLPSIGFAQSAWVAAAVLGIAAWLADPGRRRLHMAALVAALAVAMVGASQVGELRVQSNIDKAHTVVTSKEGPDATVSVIEYPNKSRHLVIDGFYASGTEVGAHYMPWMGHLPMIMHPDPREALVICFGTGQTANAVLEEGPEHLDIVDVNGTVLAMAGEFPENHGVLDDPRVEPHVMDGRAWMRRTSRRYDVVTLEPMPPTFAGSNALYSAEFYALVHQKLTEDGVVAQWLPFHLVSPEESASITATFIKQFPDSHLWIDPFGTGILVGRKSSGPLFPGFTRPVERDMTPSQVRAAMRYDRTILQEYAQLGRLVTDDNQHLSYGWGRMRWWGQGRGERDTLHYQHAILEAMRGPGAVETKIVEFLAKYPHPKAWAEAHPVGAPHP
jgi:spermidine synthase